MNFKTKINCNIRIVRIIKNRIGRLFITENEMKMKWRNLLKQNDRSSLLLT